MASLLKLSMTALAPTTTANPTVTRFFRTAPEGGYTGQLSYTIDDTDWVGDSGAPVAEHGLVPATADNGYYNLFINGQLQEGNVVTTVTVDAVTITFTEATTIEEGKIISLVVTNFEPDTSAPVITG